MQMCILVPGKVFPVIVSNVTFFPFVWSLVRIHKCALQAHDYPHISEINIFKGLWDFFFLLRTTWKNHIEF